MVWWDWYGAERANRRVWAVDASLTRSPSSKCVPMITDVGRNGYWRSSYVRLYEELSGRIFYACIISWVWCIWFSCGYNFCGCLIVLLVLYVIWKRGSLNHTRDIYFVLSESSRGGLTLDKYRCILWVIGSQTRLSWLRFPLCCGKKRSLIEWKTREILGEELARVESVNKYDFCVWFFVLLVSKSIYTVVRIFILCMFEISLIFFVYRYSLHCSILIKLVYIESLLRRFPPGPRRGPCLVRL